MAKDDKTKVKDKAPKADKGAKKAVKVATSYSLVSKETGVAYIKGNIERNGDVLSVNWRAPRSSKRYDTLLSTTDVIAACIATEEAGGYILTEHTTFASAVYSDTLTDISIEGNLLEGTDANGNQVIVNTTMVSVSATAAAAE